MSAPGKHRPAAARKVQEPRFLGAKLLMTLLLTPQMVDSVSSLQDAAKVSSSRSGPPWELAIQPGSLHVPTDLLLLSYDLTGQHIYMSAQNPSKHVLNPLVHARVKEKGFVWIHSFIAMFGPAPSPEEAYARMATVNTGTSA